MRDPRTQRRREPARNGGRDRDYPSALEIIARNLTDRIASSTALRVRHGVHDAVRWTILRLVLGWVGAATLTAAVLLVLGAGVAGLQALHWPSWLAYLSVGAFALLASLAVLKAVLGAREER